MAKELGISPVLALTATATPAVAADIRRAFGIAVADHVQTSFRRPNLSYRVTPCADRDRLALLTSRERLGRHAAFGLLAGVPFAAVLARADALAGGGAAASSPPPGYPSRPRTTVPCTSVSR